MRLSVLDLVPVRTDQTTSDALHATLSLAGVADDLGYTRYWMAEHHNMPAVAATNPPLLIAMVAAATERIRVGSGGVMLPNHAPFVVAEQFALLEAAHPGRIDLGIGRAPGSDQVTRYVLRNGATDEEIVTRFPEYVDQVATLMSREGAGVTVAGRTFGMRATPHATSRPPIWLLGSSDYSARVAAERGLPYVFAHHFSGSGTAEALELYRSTFRPSAVATEPQTFLTVNAVVADTTEEARRLALPNLRSMIRLRTGGALTAQETVDEALAAPLSAEQQSLGEAMLSRWIVDEPVAAAERIRSLAATYAVDEVMVHPVAGAVAGTSPDKSPTREQTLRLLADVLL